MATMKEGDDAMKKETQKISFWKMVARIKG